MVQRSKTIIRFQQQAVGKIPAGKVVNGIVSHMDWMPTLLAAAGAENVKEDLLKGYKAGDKKFKVHIYG